MYSKRKMIWYTFILVAGIVLLVLGCIGTLDSFWSGFGGGIAALGLAVAVLVLEFMGQKDLAMSVSFVLCGMLVVYSAVFAILQRKY